jgi:hypothetical protein
MRTPSVEELADREAIREVVNRYVRGVDRLDADCMRSAYWPDAIDDHGVFVGNAWEFVDRVMATHGRWRATLHTTTNHMIELDPGGTTARGECYNVTYLIPEPSEPAGSEAGEGHDWPGPSSVETWFGRYLDKYEKRDGEWRIIHRVCVHEATASVAVPGPMDIPADKFRQGTFDRPAAGRPIGP